MDQKPWLKHYDAGVPQTLAPYPNQPAFAMLETTAAKHPDRPCTIFHPHTSPSGAVVKPYDVFSA